MLVVHLISDVVFQTESSDPLHVLFRGCWQPASSRVVSSRRSSIIALLDVMAMWLRLLRTLQITSTSHIWTLPFLCRLSTGLLTFRPHYPGEDLLRHCSWTCCVWQCRFPFNVFALLCQSKQEVLVDREACLSLFVHCNTLASQSGKVGVQKHTLRFHWPISLHSTECVLMS